MGMYQEYIENIIDKTYKEVLPIIKRIERHKVCPKCGDYFINYKCHYCRYKDPVLKDSYHRLMQILKRFNDYLLNIPVRNIPNNKLFNLLYSLNGIELDIRDDFLKKYHYNQVIENAYIRTINQITNFSQVAISDLPLIEAIINRGEKDIDLYVDYFMYNLMSKPLYDNIYLPMITEDSFKELIRQWVEKQIGKYFDEPICHFVPLSELNQNKSPHASEVVLGDSYLNMIRLSNEELNSLYMYGSNALIKTIFHEIRHVYQDAKIMSGEEVTAEGIVMTMDRILSRYIPGYYEENYYDISYEIDADYSGTLSQFNIMRNMGFVNTQSDLIQENLADLKKRFWKMDRTVNGHPEKLDKLFLKVVFNKPEILKEYPQLKRLYKVVGNKVVAKRREEIQTDRSSVLEPVYYREDERNGTDVLYQNKL